MSATSLGNDRAGVEHHPQRHAPRVPGRRRLGRVQVAVGVEPDDARRSCRRGERLDRADVRAAAPAEDERPVGQLGSERERLLRERVVLDDAASG